MKGLLNGPHLQPEPGDGNDMLTAVCLIWIRRLKIIQKKRWICSFILRRSVLKIHRITGRNLRNMKEFIRVCIAVSSHPKKGSFIRKNWIGLSAHLHVRSAMEPDWMQRSAAAWSMARISVKFPICRFLRQQNLSVRLKIRWHVT